MFLHTQVSIAATVMDLRDRDSDLRRRLASDDGLEQSVEKMLYLGGAIVLALAALGFLYTTFSSAKSSIPNPALPTPP